MADCMGIYGSPGVCTGISSLEIEMSISRVKTLMAAAVLAGVSALGFGSVAHAATITTTLGTATCYESGSNTVMASCSGYIFGVGGANDTPGQLSGTLGSVWDIFAVTNDNANSETNEAKLLNLVTGTTTFGKDDMNKTEDNISDSMTFAFDGLYALLKLGGGNTGSYVILRNDAGETIDIDWNAGRAGGLSHYTIAGELAPVPVPAAGFLLMGALGGLAMVRRRRKA